MITVSMIVQKLVAIGQYPPAFFCKPKDGIKKEKRKKHGNNFSWHRNELYCTVHVWEEPAVGCRWTGWIREITVEGRGFRWITNYLRGIYGIYLKWMKAKSEDVNMYPVGLCETPGSWSTCVCPKTSRALVTSIS